VIGLHFVSVITFMWVVFRLRNWSEHVNAHLTHRVVGNWVWNYCVAPHNTLYHFEHHEWPSIPYYNLPQARSLDMEAAVISLRELFAIFGRLPATKALVPQEEA
jgi:fatty acid desaturase